VHTECTYQEVGVSTGLSHPCPSTCSAFHSQLHVRADPSIAILRLATVRLGFLPLDRTYLPVSAKTRGQIRSTYARRKASQLLIG
jgi:hypothetical protein